MSFTLNEAGIHFLFSNPVGGIAAELTQAGETIAVAAQENVGRDYPFRTLNPPSGPPFRRTGDMQASIRATPPLVHDGVVEVNVVADATHRGFPYPLWLRIQGYEFVDLGRFTG